MYTHYNMRNFLKTMTLIIFLSPGSYYSMGSDDIRFNVLSSYNHSSPKSITKDSYGFLWVGTDDGLLKYDGYTYTKYINSQKDTSSISNSYIRSLLLDSSGRLWVATKSGLNLYDYKADKFKVYNFGENEKNYIYEVFESSDNSIWIGTGDGLKRLDKNKDTFTSYLIYTDQKDRNNNIGTVRTFYQDIDDNFIETVNMMRNDS